MLGAQPAGLVRVNLAAYHLALPDVVGKVVVDAGTNEGAGAALFARVAARALKPGGVLLLKTPNDAFNRYENRLDSHHVSPYSYNRLRKLVEVRFEEVRLSGLTYDIGIDRSTEDRPDSISPEEHPYRFGDPIVVDRCVLLRMRVTPRMVDLTGPEAPEYLWLRATRPMATASQEIPAPGR